jgi:hypothetical protein
MVFLLCIVWLRCGSLYYVDNGETCQAGILLGPVTFAKNTKGEEEKVLVPGASRPGDNFGIAKSGDNRGDDSRIVRTRSFRGIDGISQPMVRPDEAGIK